MSTAEPWRPFGIDEREFEDAPDHNGQHVVNLTWRRGRNGQQGHGEADRAGTWLRAAMCALGVLAAAAAVVSFEAQYRMVFAAKNVAPVAALEAAIPDVAALVFASLGIALALHGRQAIRARVLNAGAVATSIAMNMLAAGHGFRDLAIWVMPPVAYALASDTAIGVIRSHAIARQRELSEALAEDETTPLAVLAGVALWLLRLSIAPPSTLKGFRTWVVEACPVAPGRRTAMPAPNVAALAAADNTPVSAAIPTGQASAAQIKPTPAAGRAARGGSKRAQLVEAYEALQGTDARYGDRSQVSPVARELAPAVSLAWSSARTVLYRHLDSKAGA